MITVINLMLMLLSLEHLSSNVAAQHLKYSVILDPQLTHKYDITMDMNKANFSEENPAPSLSQSGANMIAGDLLAITFPPNTRKPNLNYPHIIPKCVGADKMDCTVDYDITEFRDIVFKVHLNLHVQPLPGINHELLEPDERGHLPPHKLVTAYLDVDLDMDGGDKEIGYKSLVKLKKQVDDIFQVDVEDVEYEISMVEKEEKQSNAVNDEL